MPYEKPRTKDCLHHLTPAQLARRWHWHPESIRRLLRQRRISSILIGRKRLIPLEEIERVEKDNSITAAA